jgi:hypothetical protein
MEKCKDFSQTRQYFKKDLRFIRQKAEIQRAVKEGG